MKKVSVIFGTRPEAIKLCPVILELKKKSEFDCRVCVTGQHREMLDQVLQVFGVVPDVDLNLMRPNQTLCGLTALAIEAIDDYLVNDKPDAVLVQGDTTTVFCGALASFYNKIPVGHVEAGLRTWNIASPWPEEANRILTTRLAKWHFAPTAWSRQNLLQDGISAENIYVTGNTVVDALFLGLRKVKEILPVITGLPGGSLAFMENRRMVLITGHRRENFGEGFKNICQAIKDLAYTFPDVEFVYPVHLNPNVREPVMRILKQSGTQNIHLIEPQPYLPFIVLMERASVILTDSGGVQEEAPSLGKPVLVMRDTTERPEAVEAGVVKLVGAGRERIVEEVSQMLRHEFITARYSNLKNPYGDGRAREKIVEILLRQLCE